VIANNSTNIKEKNNPLAPQTIYGIGNPGLGLRQTYKCGRFNMNSNLL
jgi:hypothetical protein